MFCVFIDAIVRCDDEGYIYNHLHSTSTPPTGHQSRVGSGTTCSTTPATQANPDIGCTTPLGHLQARTPQARLGIHEDMLKASRWALAGFPWWAALWRWCSQFLLTKTTH